MDRVLYELKLKFRKIIIMDANYFIFAFNICIQESKIYFLLLFLAKLKVIATHAFNFGCCI